MSDWQPIETAPKDGTKILAWEFDDYTIAWWGVSTGGWYGWMFSDDWIRCYPTHWQPLPAPPESSGEHQNKLKTNSPDRLRAGDIWEFEMDLPIKGKRKPIAQLSQWRVIGWHQGECAWQLKTIDGKHTTYLMEFAPSYEEMRFVRHDASPTP